jgi:hypothetical protein
LFTGFSGIYLGFRVFKNFRYITKEDVKPRFLVSNSIIAGTSGFLIFFSIILTMGFLDETYIWNTNKFLGAIFISLIPGVIITIGSFIQALMITGYKKAVFDALKRKRKDH